MKDYSFHVNNEACVACALCVSDCPVGVMAMDGDLPIIANDDGCMGCLHCFAVCPTGAISFLGREPGDATPLQGNLPSFEQMSTLIKGRRSTRSYKDENVEPELLDRLFEAVNHAPTGHNSQSVRYTLIDDKEKTGRLADEVRVRLAALASQDKLPDTPLKPFLELGLSLHEQTGVDIFFRGAPHLVIASAPKGGPSPATDTIIGLAYLELAARAMNLGTLWDGMVKHVICDLFPDLREKLGIPADHHIGYAMLLGKPAVKYARTVERGQAAIHRPDW